MLPEILGKLFVDWMIVFCLVAVMVTMLGMIFHQSRKVRL